MPAQELSADYAALRSYLRRWWRRSRWQATAIWLPRALLIGLWLSIALALATRIRPWLLQDELLRWSLLNSLACTFIVILWQWLWPRSPLQIARQFEIELGLQERLSTALELQAGTIQTSELLSTYQLRDSLTNAASIITNQAIAIRLPWREWCLFFASLLLLVTLIALPNPQDGLQRWQQAVARELSDAGAALEEARDSILNAESLDPTRRERFLGDLEETLAALKNEALSREEAVASLYEATQYLEDSRAALAERAAAIENSLSRAETALRRDAGGDNSERPADLKTALQEWQQQLSSLSIEQRSLLAQALREAGEAFSETNPDLSRSLQQATIALEQDDLSATDDALARAITESETLQSEQDINSASRKLQRAAQNLETAAKDLAEVDSDGSGAAQGDEPRERSQSAGDFGERAAVGDTPEGSAHEGMGGGLSDSDESSPTGDGSGQAGGAGNATSGQNDNQRSPASDEATSGGNQPDGSGRGHYDTLYAPKARLENPSQMGIELAAESSNILVNQGELSENPPGKAHIPYAQLYRSYQTQANKTLETEYIPLGLRAVVRSYFQALEPAP